MNVRFTPQQLESLVAANAAAELFTELYGVSHRVDYVYDLIDELRADGGDESLEIANELEAETIWANLDDEVTCDECWGRASERALYLRQEIGWFQSFGDFVILTEN